ncbi:Zn-ribbon domain-containing protein [Halopenitus sp. H-Gu1]|uniref:Zn-ribbon domain-containing protein n=1 Tax=Halopenitus sp. H-Gu1 TaxID=3242697 RepID=UPI00359E0CF9
MPHQCIECGRTFADGSKEMLSGCPDCGGNKFQFKPRSAIDPENRSGGSFESDDRATSADARSSDFGDDDVDDSEVDPDEASVVDQDTPVAEDDAQADARSAVVSSDELSVARESDAFGSPDDPASDRPEEATTTSPEETPSDETVVPDSDRDPDPELAELREKLNDQFESIRIVSPGQYELNLMELYDRQEYIISLQEDGRYVIEMPGDWGPDED